MPLSKSTTLAALGVTSTAAEVNTTTGATARKSWSATVAAAGSNQGTATALTADVNIVSGADDATGVRLPTATATSVIYVANTSPSAALYVYPATGGQINAQGADGSIPIGPDRDAVFVARSTTQWYMPNIARSLVPYADLSAIQDLIDSGLSSSDLTFLNTFLSNLNNNATSSAAVVNGSGLLSTQSDNFTVNDFDTGLTYLVTAADKTASLPATAAGLRYRFIVTAAGLSAAGTGFSISPDAADKIMGAVLGAQITSADNKDLINTGATDAEGNFVELLGDGVDGWYIIDGVGIWARQA